ncbi:hypothetical protein MTO96_015675 [Rhipicephalus appendiculatus]
MPSRAAFRDEDAEGARLSGFPGRRQPDRYPIEATAPRRKSRTLSHGASSAPSTQPLRWLRRTSRPTPTVVQQLQQTRLSVGSCSFLLRAIAEPRIVVGMVKEAVEGSALLSLRSGLQAKVSEIACGRTRQLEKKRTKERGLFFRTQI